MFLQERNHLHLAFVVIIKQPHCININIWSLCKIYYHVLTLMNSRFVLALCVLNRK